MGSTSSRWVRRSALAGVVASACYAVGDVLMLGRRGTPAEHRLLREEPGLDSAAAVFLGPPTKRLRAGALWGVFATPLHVASAWQLYDALRPAGTARAARIAGTFAGAQSLASYIHGTFYPWGATFHAAEQAEPGSGQRAALLDQGKEISRGLHVPYLVFGTAMAVVSIETAVLTYQRRTRYPVWAAHFTTPLTPVGLAVAAMRLLPRRYRQRWEGAGISLGQLAANAVAAVARG
jgi:hypothetical protein